MTFTLSRKFILLFTFCSLVQLEIFLKNVKKAASEQQPEGLHRAAAGGISLRDLGAAGGAPPGGGGGAAGAADGAGRSGRGADPLRL